MSAVLQTGGTVYRNGLNSGDHVGAGRDPLLWTEPHVILSWVLQQIDGRACVHQQTGCGWSWVPVSALLGDGRVCFPRRGWGPGQCACQLSSSTHVPRSPAGRKLPPVSLPPVGPLTPRRPRTPASTPVHLSCVSHMPQAQSVTCRPRPASLTSLSAGGSEGRGLRAASGPSGSGP